MSWTKWPCLPLTTPTQILLEELLAFPNLHCHSKKISSFHQFTEIHSIFESHDQTSHAYFWLCPSKKNWSTFNLCEFVSTCKKSSHFIDLFWRYGLLKILQSNWLRISWPSSKEKNFSKENFFPKYMQENSKFSLQNNFSKIYWPNFSIN